MEYFRLRGIGVSPGIAIGEVSLTERVVFIERKDLISPDKIQQELGRLDKAVGRTKTQLTRIKEQIKRKVGEEHSFILDAHLLMLEDKSMRSGLERIIKEESCRAEWALFCIHRKYKHLFESISDEYFRQRQSDVSDVLTKIYRNLESPDKKKKDDDREKILVAHDLLPSEAALKLSRGNVLAVAIDMGGQTSHTAIL
ncbi:MAG: phosphoenolpyruvate--protein phosphotransferase, partial [Candidatus Aminicenantes bacterium]|nr:phosphoenolpyruvate--protein phosphotransferase [Candidatus Aminicenantes bacterium]